MRRLARRALPQDLRRYYVLKRHSWAPVPTLREEHIRNCRLVTDRNKLLEHLPKGGVCGEIGVAKGHYSSRILKATEPQTLHLFDNDPAVISKAEAKFAAEVEAGKVVLHLGDSSSALKSLSGVQFDWVYIDGDHSYEGCKRDLLAVRERMKPGGIIALNDYAYISMPAFVKLGVVEAAHEFCLNYDYELIYLALAGRTKYDVALRPIGGGA